MHALIDRPNYFTGLPRDYYLSPTIFAVERERIWNRMWLYFGHVSQIPDAGSVLTRDILGDSVLVTRDASGTLHAMLNVCRHRGYRICEPGAHGNKKALVCPYHGWTYNLDGSLRRAPSMTNAKDFEFNEFGLKSVHLDVWEGFIFVAMGLDPPEERVSAAGSRLAPDVSRVEPENIKQCYEHTRVIEANWKIVLENYLECYHCSGLHPELMRTLNLAATHELTAGYPSGAYWPSSAPLKTGTQSGTMSGNFASRKLFGEFGKGIEPPVGWSAGFIVQPAITGVTFHADHGYTHEIKPIDVRHTELVGRWFVRADAEEGVDFLTDDVTHVWAATNEQDAHICERVQRGVDSLRYEPGPYSRTREPAIHASLSSYLDMMGEDHFR